MILVTGAAGLVGYSVVHRLVREGSEVVATDSRPPPESLDCRFVEADLRDSMAMSAIFADHRIRKVVHAGAISGSMVAPDDPLRVMTVNVAGTIYLAEACRLAQVERLIALSSIGVYGDQAGTKPVTEDAPRSGTDIYSCSKIAMESVLLGYRVNFGLPVHLLRMSSIFGPHRRTPCFVRGLIEATEEGHEAIASDDTQHRRQFLYIEDAVEAVNLALAAPCIRNFAYNITGGTWLTESEVVDIARQALPTLKARVENVPPLGLDGRMGALDTTLATADLGYRPRVALREGIAKYARSRKQLGS